MLQPLEMGHTPHEVPLLSAVVWCLQFQLCEETGRGTDTIFGEWEEEVGEEY